MSSGWARAGALAAVLAGAALPAAAPLAAQRRTAPDYELGAGAVGTLTDEVIVLAAGVQGGWRPSARMRVTAFAGPGLGSDLETDALVGRGELAVHFLASPYSRGIGFYGGGGVAGVVGGGVDQGYVLLTLGVEHRPGGRGGWWIEAGIGGGPRLAAGWRWRRWH